MGQDVCVICNGSQLVVTHTFDDANPTWYDSAPGLPVGAVIYGFAIDPDGAGVWCLTGGSGDPTQMGIFRCDDIIAVNPAFSLVYSQAQASIDGKAALTALGWGLTPAFGEMGSIATGANGGVVAVERKWSGFADRPPSCVFVTTNSGGSFTAYVTSESNPHMFWAEVYLSLYGCHQIWWDGSQYVIGGTTGYPNWHYYQATASSADGTAWAITEAAAPNYLYPRTYANGYSLFDEIAGVPTNKLVQLPTTEIVQPSYHGIWYRHFDFGGTQCYIHEDVGASLTQNYLNVGGADVVDSLDVFATHRIGGAALRDAVTYILVPSDLLVTGMIVCSRTGGVNTDKTGNLLTVLGGTWAGGPYGHLDNLQVEFIARGVGSIYTHKVRMN